MMSPPATTHACPKCNRQLQSCGIATIEGEELHVYQCDECTMPWEMEPGETIDTALTFAVDAQGRALHPDTGEPLQS